MRKIFLLIMFLILLVGCSEVEQTDADKNLDNIQEKDLEEEKKTDNNNNVKESNEISKSTIESEDNQSKISKLSKSDLTVEKNHILNKLGSFKIVYKDIDGSHYIEDQNTGFIYEYDDYFQNESLWGEFIEEYDISLQNYYNESSDSINSNISGIFNYVDGEALNIIKNNKFSGNFAQHTSTIEFKKAYRNSETSVVIVATRNYKHISGEGSVTNNYYIDLINGNKITHWEEQ